MSLTKAPIKNGIKTMVKLRDGGLRLLLGLLLALLVWGMPIWGMPVSAAEPLVPPADASVTEPTLGRSLDADDISAEKINQFVRAYLKVLALIEGREAELQGAEMELESQQIQREIEAQAIGLIQAEKLNLQEYLQLLSFTNIDPEFGERVATQMQEAVQ